MSVDDIRTKMGLLNDYTNQDMGALESILRDIGLAIKMPVDFKSTSSQESAISYIHSAIVAMGDNTTSVSDIRAALSRIDRKLPLVEKCIREGYTEICYGYDHSDDREEDEEGGDDDGDYDDGG